MKIAMSYKTKSNKSKDFVFSYDVKQSSFSVEISAVMFSSC